MVEGPSPEEIAEWKPSMPGRLRHHLIPQFYLRRFADERGRLTLLRRSGGERVRSSVKNAAVRAGYYDVPIDGSWWGDVERGISAMESLGAQAIQSLLAGELLSDEHRFRLSVFMGMQLVRGPDFADSAVAAARATQQLSEEASTEAHIREVLLRAGTSPSPERVRDVLARSSGSFEDVPPHEFFRVAALPEAAEHFGEYFYNRRWQLMRFPQPCLLTGDRPIVLWGRPHPKEPVGLANARVIFYPLSADAALSMHLAPVKQGIFRTRLEASRTLNAIVAASAYEWVYHEPSLTPLDGVELPPPEPLVRIEEPTYEILGGTIRERRRIIPSMPTPPAGWTPP